MYSLLPYNIGVLGYADIAKRSVIPSILKNSNFKLVAIASKTKVISDELLQSYGNPTIYKDYDSLISDERIDCVYIPLPTGLHYKWIMEALKSGKHVYCEKSLVTSLQQALEIHNLSEISQLSVIENFQFRKHRQLNEIKKIISNNDLGELHLVRVSFCFPAFRDKKNIRYIKELGGGALFDAGAYTVKLLSEIGLTQFDVKSFVSFNTEFGVDISGSVTGVDGRTSIQLYFGFDDCYQCSVEILGSEKKLSTDRIFTAPEHYAPKIKISNSAGTFENIEVKPDNHFDNMLKYFFESMTDLKIQRQERDGNIRQAEQIEKIWSLANEK